MTSVQSAYAITNKPATKFFALITPSYDDSVIVPGEIIRLPIPFIVVNQVLDINVEQSSDVQALVTNGTAPDDQSSLQGKAMGGASLVKSFGPNMTTYLRNWINIHESLGAAYTGPLVVYIPPFMTKVQMAIPSFGVNNDTGAFRRDRSWGITSQAPVSTEYIGGGPADNFFTTWIFKTPITIQYEVTGGLKYITMTTQYAEE